MRLRAEKPVVASLTATVILLLWALAIGGPIVELDMRTGYLRDLRIIGCTAWDEPVFPNLVSYIEKGEIRPLLAATYPRLTSSIAGHLALSPPRQPPP